jgi:hypothetical protein
VEHLCDQLVRTGAQLRAAEDDRVAADDRVGQRAGGEYAGAVPRSHAEDHAGRHADRHRQSSGLVGGNRLALDLRGETCGLAQEVGGQESVEARPQGSCAHFLAHGLDELRGSLVHDVGGLEQDGASLAGARPGPRGESRRGRVHGRDGVTDVCRCRTGHEVTAERVVSLERPSVRGVLRLVVDDELGLHGCP